MFDYVVCTKLTMKDAMKTLPGLIGMLVRKVHPTDQTDLCKLDCPIPISTC